MRVPGGDELRGRHHDAILLPGCGFTDTGTNHNISGEYVVPLLARQVQNLRSFPNGTRNCYTLRSLVSGLNRPPALFDLYIGVNFWMAVVNMSSSLDQEGGMVITEAIVVVPDDFVQVCLVNTAAGTPFISGLEPRSLKRTLYPQATTAQGLVNRARFNVAPTNKSYIASLQVP